MKKSALVVMALFLWACGRGPAEEVLFNRAQPAGQKSTYSVENKMQIASTIPDPHGHGDAGDLESKADVDLRVRIETEVTSADSYGNWTLTTRFADASITIDGAPEEQTAQSLRGKSFTATIDKEGRILDVAGMEDLIPGMDMKQMLSQINPTMMLPDRSVRVGESWDFEIATPMQFEDSTVEQKIAGKGTLKNVSGEEATLEFEYELSMSFTGEGNGAASVTGTGKGKSTVLYDINRARFINNRSETVIETVGRIEGRATPVRNSFTSALQVDLVNR